VDGFILYTLDKGTLRCDTVLSYTASFEVVFQTQRQHRTVDDFAVDGDRFVDVNEASLNGLDVEPVVLFQLLLCRIVGGALELNGED
jgi:hypothetical protein